MKFIPTAIDGSFVIEQQRVTDERGYFARQWCRSEMVANGLDGDLTQINTSLNPRAGTLRGLHFQLPPHAETKIASCPRGAFFDVVVDLRVESPTFRQWFGVELTEDNGLSLYLPKGCAHGCLTLREFSVVTYSTSSAYAPGSARGFRYNDAAFNIQWPRPVEVISHADNSWPAFAEKS